MILRGRITIYGEYLMKTCTRGLVIPAEQFLATGDHVDKPIHFDYDHSQDLVARFLERRDFITENQIRGDLPFGYGLASSTALAFLHTSRLLSVRDSIPVVRDCDREMHGFEPSGVDAAAIASQSPGFFSSRGWESIPLSPIRYSIAFVPPERARSLAEVERSIQSKSKGLNKIADALTRGILATSVLDYGLLLDYSRALFSISVYSSFANWIVAEMLTCGIAAKAIGGLYDKAILVVWPNTESENLYGHLLDGYKQPPNAVVPITR